MKARIRTRLSLATTALVAATAAIVIAIVYVATVSTLNERASETVHDELDSLVMHWRKGGVSDLVGEVQRRSMETDGDGFVYLLAREEQQPVVGNIREWPTGHQTGEQASQIPVTHREADVWLLKHVSLESIQVDDYQLLVGRDFSHHDEAIDTLGTAALAGLGFTALLAIAAGLSVGQRLLGRVEGMQSKIASILRGAREERVAVGTAGDEFDELAMHFNELLDENERLLAQVREATNNIAHDLRTPLQRMRSRIEGALSAGGDDAGSELLYELSGDVDHLLETFNGILQIARVEADEIREGMEPTSVALLVDDIRDLYEPLAEEVEMTLAIDIEPDLDVVMDRQLLSQAIANLVDNAIKYAREGGLIAIQAHRRGDRVVLGVGDRGPGIPEEDRARVVERLVRLDASRTVPGSGLGLSFVSAVARLHGADLQLVDNEPGLRAEISLPLAP